jgi:hypothetical protein
VLLATNFLHVRDSHAAKPDTLLGLVIILALGVIIPLTRTPTVARAAVAGVVIGLATAVKYPAVFQLAIAYLAICMGSEARGWRRLFPAPWFATCAAAIATFVATSPDVVFNPRTLSQVVDILRAAYPQLSPKVVYTPPPIPGLPMDEPWWGSFVYHARFSLRYGAGLLATLLAPAAVIWGIASGRPLAVLTAASAVVYYVMISGSPVGLARYMTPLMPWLALLEAGMLGALVARIHDRRWAAVALFLGTLALATEPLMSAVAHNRVIDHTDTRVLATRWMAENLPQGAKVVVLGNQVWFWGQPQFAPGMRLATVKPDIESLQQAGVGYVLTHEHVLFSSRVDPAVIERLGPYLRLVADFDPSVPGRDDAIFEARDAYYVPFHGFGAVTRPGPRVRIYAIDERREP